MNVDTMDALRDAGVDLDGALKRFSGNMQLFERFLMRFPEDKTFEQLTDAFKAEDVRDAFVAAHTLKGVAGNLGIDNVFKVTSEMVELLRNEKLGEAREIYPRLRQEYERICGILAGEP